MYRIHRGPASQTVPVKDIVLSRSTVPTSQPIKETRLRLAVQVSMRRSRRRSSRLSWSTGKPLYVSPRQKREYARRRYVNFSLTCLEFYWCQRRRDSNRTDIRPQCTSARTATLCRSSSLGLATRTCELWISSSIYKLMNDSEHWHRTRGPREYSTPISALHKTMAYTPFLVPLLQSTHHTLGEVYKSKERANNRVRTSYCELRCIEASDVHSSW